MENENGRGGGRGHVEQLGWRPRLSGGVDNVSVCRGGRTRDGQCGSSDRDLGGDGARTGRGVEGVYPIQRLGLAPIGGSDNRVREKDASESSETSGGERWARVAEHVAWVCTRACFRLLLLGSVTRAWTCAYDWTI